MISSTSCKPTFLSLWKARRESVSTLSRGLLTTEDSLLAGLTETNWFPWFPAVKVVAWGGPAVFVV